MAMQWPKIEYRESADGMLDPVLNFPKQPNGSVGKYGGMRLDYLQNHRKATLSMMVLEGTLKTHLMEVNEQANRMVEELIEKMMEKVPSPDKVANTLGWIQYMNSLKTQAEEIVIHQLIYA